MTELDLNREEDRVHVHGKQLMMDGRHMADCANEEIAAVIAICLQNCKLVDTTPAQTKFVYAFFA